MSKYTEKLAAAYELAKVRLAIACTPTEANHDLLAQIIVAIAIERPTRFGKIETWAEEVIRRYELATEDQS